MTVDDAYSFIEFLARKNSTGSITPSEFNSTFNSAQRSWFDTLLGKITIAPHVALGQNERIVERLKPFKITDQSISVSSQIATYPSGFQAITSMASSTGNTIKYMDDTRLKERLKSVIDPIADANPGAYTLAPTGWKIWPATLNSVIVSYYKLPTNVIWGYTVGGDGRKVYNSGTSTQPLWDEVSMEEIIARQCTLLGISFQSTNLVQYGEMVKTQGA